MGEKFKELVEEINKLTEETDIKKVVEDFEITEEEASQNVDTWIKEVIESLEKLDKKKLPYLLHYLYISENKIKIYFGDAVEILPQLNEKYDIIFLDHMMPDMDGIETFRRLRKKNGFYFKEVPVIALTANTVLGAREFL